MSFMRLIFDMLVEATTIHPILSYFSCYNHIKMPPDEVEKKICKTSIGTSISESCRLISRLLKQLINEMTVMFYDMLHDSLEDYVDDIIIKY